MRLGRRAAVGIVGIVVMALSASWSAADTAATYLPPGGLGGSASRVMLVADRAFGFTPLTVNLSGMLRDRGGDLFPVEAGRSVRLVVESPFVSIHSGPTIVSLAPDLHYEAVTAGPAEPTAIRRSVEIRRPGRYTFRVQVIAPDGQVLSSNEVSVRAL